MDAYKNPMEWVGEGHNAAVKWVIGSSAGDPKMTSEQALVKVEKLIGQYFGAVGIATPAHTLPKKIDEDPKSAISVAEKRGAFTSKAAPTFLKLLTTIQKEQPLQSLLKEIAQQEHAAVGSLGGSDLLFFQSLAAVARQSARLWAPVAEGGEGFQGGEKTFRFPWPKHWPRVVLVDVLGFLGGGIVGAVYYSILVWIVDSI